MNDICESSGSSSSRSASHIASPKLWTSFESELKKTSSYCGSKLCGCGNGGEYDGEAICVATNTIDSSIHAQPSEARVASTIPRTAAAATAKKPTPADNLASVHTGRVMS